MFIKEGIKILSNGTDIKSRQLSLFSICGIMALIDTLVILNGFWNLRIYEQIAYLVLWIVFLLFFTGYETLFLRERELPEIDMRSINIVFNKTLLSIFLIEFALFFIRLVFHNNFFTILSDLLLAVPLVAIQAGYSYNFDDNQSFELLKRTNFKLFFNLAWKRFLMTLCAYSIVIFILLIMFLGLGIGLLIAAKGQIDYLIYTFAAQQHVIFKLTLFISGILLEYILTNTVLVWDYELLKSYENSSAKYNE